MWLSILMGMALWNYHPGMVRPLFLPAPWKLAHQCLRHWKTKEKKRRKCKNFSSYKHRLSILGANHWIASFVTTCAGERWELGIKSQRFIRVQTCVLYKNKSQVLLSARFISGYSKRGKHTNYGKKKIVTEGHTFFYFRLLYFVIEMMMKSLSKLQLVSCSSHRTPASRVGN